MPPVEKGGSVPATWELLLGKLRELPLTESPRRELFALRAGKSPQWIGDADALSVFAQTTGQFCSGPCARCTLARTLKLSSVVTGLPIV